jgi:hypothetical protein
MITQMEVCGLEMYEQLGPNGEDGPDAESVRRLVGGSRLLARLWPQRQVLFNTGFVMLQPCVCRREEGRRLQVNLGLRCAARPFA